MPELVLDSVSFGQGQPTVDELAAADVRAIMFYSRVSTPPRAYLNECVARGIGVCPIFETAAQRANDGYEAGRADGVAAYGDLSQIGVPDGTRLYVNVADTPGPSPVDQIAEYARGFGETFPLNWLLGAYGNLAALQAAQRGSQRFDKWWAVETWGSPVGSVDDHWRFWLAQGGPVVLVQMANVGDPFGGTTDTNWLAPGARLDAWGPVESPLVGLRYPLDGPVRVNSPWGPRDGGFHYGLDLWAQDGDNCYALADGTCFYAAREDAGGNHQAFYFDVPPTPSAPKFGYMHLKDFVVGPGTHVQAGQLVAHTGSTGQSTGPHLHVWGGFDAGSGAIDLSPWLLNPTGPPPAPLPDFDRIQLALNAMRGDDAMAMVLYGDFEVNFHVDAGKLVHNSTNRVTGETVVRDEVLLTGLDNTQPAARVDGGNVVVCAVQRGGKLRRIAWIGAESRWVDTRHNNATLRDVHPL